MRCFLPAFACPAANWDPVNFTVFINFFHAYSTARQDTSASHTTPNNIRAHTTQSNDDGWPADGDCCLMRVVCGGPRGVSTRIPHAILFGCNFTTTTRMCIGKPKSLDLCILYGLKMASLMSLFVWVWISESFVAAGVIWTFDSAAICMRVHISTLQ